MPFSSELYLYRLLFELVNTVPFGVAAVCLCLADVFVMFRIFLGIMLCRGSFINHPDRGR